VHSRGQSIASPPRPEEGLASGDNGVRRTGQKIILLALFLFVLWMAQSYLVAAAWGTVIAIAVWPLYQYVANAVSRFAPVSARRNWLAALLTTIATALILAVPVSVGLSEIARQAQAVVNWIGQAQQAGIEVPDWVKRLPLLGERLSDRHALGSLLNNIDMDRLAVWASGLSGAFTHLLLIALLTLMTLYFLLRDGTAISDRLAMLAKFWLGQPGKRFLQELVTAVRGVVNGTVVVAVAEGLPISVGYWLAKVPHSVTFAILTIVFAMLPLGAWVAFTAATIALLLNGGTPLVALGLFGWGVVVMLTGDNFVQPALIGGAARLPFLLSLVAILGGIETFGLVGVFLGPIIMAAFLTALREWTYNESL
jgi:predicted PurR-regulated permease PerM